jgi:16S rRNA (cytosine1402-N4)-methyltransferase
MLSEHGRLAILSYHSLEDRAVKERFRALAGATGFTVVTRKAARASEAEVSVNPRARSAKLRCIEREAR